MLLLKLYLTPCKNFLLLCFLIRRLLILFSVPLALALIGFLIMLGLGWHRTWGFGEQLDWDIKVMSQIQGWTGTEDMCKLTNIEC